MEPTHPAYSPGEPPLPLGTVGDGPAQHPQTIARWAIGFSDPLVDVRTRLARTEAMVRFVERNTAWTTAFFAGVLHELMLTLPGQDPWRLMSGCVDFDEIETGVAADPSDPLLSLAGEPTRNRTVLRQRTPVPNRTGAITARDTWFGSLEDVADITPPDTPDAASDIGVSAVTAPMSPLSAAVLAFSAGRVRELQQLLQAIQRHLWLAEVRGVLGGESAAAIYLETVTTVVRWIQFRRRSYLGDDDGYLLSLMIAWIPSAERVVGGRPIATEVGQFRAAMIDADAYSIALGHHVEDEF